MKRVVLRRSRGTEGRWPTFLSPAPAADHQIGQHGRLPSLAGTGRNDKNRRAQMGLMKKLRNELVDIIEWIDDS